MHLVDLAQAAKDVAEQTAVFGPLVLLLMEMVKLFLRNRLPKTDPGFQAEKKRVGDLRRLVQAALSVGLPALYQVANGGIDWRVAPFVWLLAFATSFLGHKARNANEQADSGVPA